MAEDGTFDKSSFGSYLIYRLTLLEEIETDFLARNLWFTRFLHFPWA